MSFVRHALVPFGMPSLNSFTAVNAGGRATRVAANAGGIQMSMSNGAVADDFRILKTAAPTPPYTLTVHVFSTLYNTNYSGCGLIWRASSTGHIQTLGYHAYQSSMNLLIRNESANNNGTSPTYTTGSDLIGVSVDVVIAAGPGIWFQLHDDGTTNRVFRYSNDGQTFQTLVTTGRTTTITPDEVGIFIGNVNSGGTATEAAALFDSWWIT